MQAERSQSTARSATIFGRLRQTRGFGVYMLLVLLAPILVAITVGSAIERQRHPDVGMTVNERIEIEGLDARWEEARHGDRVLQVDGQQLSSPAHWVSAALARGPGDPVTMTFLRGGRRWTETAAATEISAVDRFALNARVATAAAVLAIGLVAFLLRPGTPATWLLMLGAWNFGVLLLLKVWLYADPLRYKHAQAYPFVVGIVLGLHFVCIFPQRLSFLGTRPLRVLWLYLGLLVAPAMDALATHALVTVAGAVFATVTTLLGAAVLLLQYRQVRATGDARGRSQLRASTVGMLAGVGVPGVWNHIRLVFGVAAGPWSTHYNALPCVLFVGMITYAVVRHNALAIDRFTASVVGYAATTAILGGSFAAALVGVPLLLGQSTIGESRVILVVGVALMFGGFAPVYRRVRRLVDRRFFRADAVQIADALSELVGTLQRTAPNAVVTRALATTARVLHCDRAELWLLSEDGQTLTRDRSTQVDVSAATLLPAGSALAITLKNGITAGVDRLAPRAMDSTAQDELWERELAMASPIVINMVPAGFIGVGRKLSGMAYEMEELSFLAMVAAQLGTALERQRGDKTILDRYHLERRLGTGGMAEVFLAWQVGPGGFERKVALKRPLPHVSEDRNAVAAFLDEARVAAQLRHANIAQVYDVGESVGGYFIVMEYVDGPTLRHVLRDLCERNERIPISVAVAITISVLAALGYAHQHHDERGRALHLVHRDITPRNVLVNRRGEVKLVDFGIARAQHQLHVTHTGAVKGTLAYMSPEQAEGRAVDQRSDLYAAGALLYELLTGSMAYRDGPSRKPPRPATELRLDLSPELECLLMRAMEYDADKRFATAAEQSHALVAALVPNEPASAEEVARWLGAAYPSAQQRESKPAETDD